MTLFDSLKNVFRGNAEPKALSWTKKCLEAIERGDPFDRIAQGLRESWLEGELDLAGRQANLEKEILPKLKEKYPQHSTVADLMLGCYGEQGPEYYTDALYQQAIEFRRQKQWPVEAVLYLAKFYLRNAMQTRGYNFLLHELFGDAGPYVSVELCRRHRLFDAILFERSRAIGEESMTLVDGLAAAELAREHCIHGLRYANTIQSRLEGILPAEAAATAAKKLDASIDNARHQTEDLIARKAVGVGPNFAAVARCQPKQTMKSTVIQKVCDAVLDERCRQSSVGFQAVDSKAQKEHLRGFSAHVNQVTSDYDGYLPLLELDAELCTLNGEHAKAAQLFDRLLSKKPASAYFAYRAGVAYQRLADPLASRYLIHASRQPDSNWQDSIAGGRAAIAAYEFEGAALRDVFPEKRGECGALLADRLERHFVAAASHWDFATSVPLATRIAHLRHLAFEAAPQDETRYQLACEAYDRLNLDARKQLQNRVPEEVFDPIKSFSEAST